MTVQSGRLTGARYIQSSALSTYNHEGTQAI
jgi:hypothetical protein